MTQTWITHPATGGVALVGAEAFAVLWDPKAWQRVEIDYAAASAAAGVPITRPGQLTETYVRERAAEQLAAAIEAENTPAPEPVETTTSTRRAGRTKAEES